MKDINLRHEYDNLMWHIPIYDGKNMSWAELLLQMEKVQNSKEYEWAIAKYTSILYKMSKIMDGAGSLHEIRKRKYYSPTVTEVHAASDLHGKQWPEKTLQEYIQNFTDLTEKGTIPGQYHQYSDHISINQEFITQRY